MNQRHEQYLSIAELRRRGQEVFEGTTVKEGFLHVHAEKADNDRHLNRMIHLVEESLFQRSPIERKADVLARCLTI